MPPVLGPSVVEIRWVANPFRGDRFAELWHPVAESALEYGASAYAFFRMKEDQAIFTQLAFFESKMDFERYWYSESVSDARARAAGLFQVPVLPQWHGVIGFSSRALSPVET